MTADLNIQQQQAMALARARKRKAMAVKTGAPESKPSFGKTVFDQGMQGATFGFSDEIIGPLGASMATLARDPKGFIRGETEDPALAGELANVKRSTQAELNNQFQERPITSIVSNLAGGLATGVAGASTKAGAAIGNSLRNGNLAARAAKGAVAGAASGAAYGAGTAQTGERLKGAGQGGLLGGVLGAAAPVVTNALSGLNTSLGKKSPIPNADKLREKASGLYKQAESLGGVLKPDFTNKFIDEVEKLKPQTDIGRIVGGDTPFTQVVDRLSAIRDKPITLDAAQELDELLGDAIDGFTDMGKLTKQGKKLLDIQTSFRNMIEDAPEELIEGGKEGFEALKQGRKLWSTSRKLADVERIIARAELTDNPATSIKTGFRTLLTNPNRIKGFTTAERAAIKRASQTGIISDTLRVFGSRLIPIVSTVSGGGLGSTAASQAISMASRGGATKLQLNKAQKVAEVIANQGIPSRQPLLRLKAPNTAGVLTGNTSDKIR